MVLETTNLNGDKQQVNLNVTTRIEPQFIFDGFNIPIISAELNDPDVAECNNENIDAKKVSVTMSVSSI